MRRMENIFMSSRFPLCIHPVLRNFVGTVNVDAGHHIHLTMSGTFEGANVDEPFDVRLQSDPLIKLPGWLRAIHASSSYLCPSFTCEGSTCIAYAVRLESGVLRWTTDVVDCERWTLMIPYVPQISLERLVGMRPVHVVVSQGTRTFADFTIQRMQHCVHLHH